MMYNVCEKILNPRQCIEETILHFNPDISDKDLLDLREQIYYDVWQKTHSKYVFSHTVEITIYILRRNM